MARRIADNETRGFELVKTFEHETEGNVWVNSGYKNVNGAKYRHAGSQSYMHYSAVMRRDNAEYLARKQLEAATI